MVVIYAPLHLLKTKGTKRKNGPEGFVDSRVEKFKGRHVAEGSGQDAAMISS